MNRKRNYNKKHEDNLMSYDEYDDSIFEDYIMLPEVEEREFVRAGYHK